MPCNHFRPNLKKKVYSLHNSTTRQRRFPVPLSFTQKSDLQTDLSPTCRPPGFLEPQRVAELQRQILPHRDQRLAVERAIPAVHREQEQVVARLDDPVHSALPAQGLRFGVVLHEVAPRQVR